MISLNISLPHLQLFFLIFIRVGAILMSMPVFDSKSIPLFFKVALAFATSIILFPMLKMDPMPMSTHVFTLGISVAGEILFGLPKVYFLLHFLGLLVYIFLMFLW